jgi:peptidoglycan/LPS O-acetylase OafA/YrhL
MPWLTRWGDASYAIYLLAFPVEQLTVSALGNDAAPAAVIAIALPVSWALALLSWRFVEAPMLTLKRRLPESGRRQPSTALGAAPGLSAPPPAVPPLS